MKPKILRIDVPKSYTIVKNVLSDYDPQLNFTEDNNLSYLQEDLFQITNNSTGITIDLGWYGNLIKNDGAFKLYVIKDFDWDNPIVEKQSKSINEILKVLIEEIKAHRKASA